MDIRGVADELKKWALANRMLGGDYQVAPHVNSAAIRDIFWKVGLPTATAILQHRQISYIGINELKDEIIVFTKRKMSAADQRKLQNAGIGTGKDRINLVFMHSGIAQVGGPPQLHRGLPHTR